ncbi:hypothetical protein [Nocardiopsis sp. JB363]|uniref:fluoroquinolone export ABC transporter permease subunit n=1 Tax=Nocardiopsis sp. JB363 TaxID=1434837 RepID=UPI000979E472|nr:hypothetical protein [Nocardiopsis sp. JB363]SIO86581.1 D-alanyl-D-alanine carboxypeptidase [Nocardiopsis sp. JB363]
MTRLLGACVVEAKVARRYGIVAIAAILAVLWTALLAALPASTAVAVAPYLLFLDTAGFGALFAVALLMFERVEGTDAARAVTPVGPGTATVARVLVLTLAAVAIAVPVTMVVPTGDRFWSALGLTTAGVLLTSVLLVGVCLGLGARTRTLQGALLVIAPALVPLIVVPVLHMTEIVRIPMLWAVPTTAGAELIHHGATGQVGASGGPGMMLALPYALGCAVAVCRWAAMAPAEPTGGAPRRHGSVSKTAREPKPDRVRDRGATGRRGHVRAGSASPSGRKRHPLLGLVRWELVGVRRDPLLTIIVLVLVPLFLALRWAYPVLVEYLWSAHRFDLLPHAPAVFGALLLHVPLMVGAAVALRVVEDVDDRILLLLRVSPLSPTAYFGFWSGTAALLTLVGLLLSVPLSGLAPEWSPGLVTAVALATSVAPLVVLTTTALASNKVEALVVLKGAAAVSILVPSLLWILPASWGTPLLVLPPAWAFLALTRSPTDAVFATSILIGGLSTTVIVSLLLARRIGSRLRS